MKSVINRTCWMLLISGIFIHQFSKGQDTRVNSGTIQFETNRIAKVGAAGQQFTQKLKINTTYHFLRNKARYESVLMGNIRSEVYLETEDKEHYQALTHRGKDYAVIIPTNGEVVKVLDETREILGYSCTKALVRYNDKEATVYFTQLIPYNHSPVGNFTLGGAVLAFESEEINAIATTIDPVDISDQDVTLSQDRKKISLEEKKALLASR